MPELSPDGYYYRFDPSLPPGQRLWRRSKPTEPWGQGKPTFSIQHMSAAELRFVAALIDAARSVNMHL